MSASRAQLRRLMKRLEPPLRDAFLRAIDQARGRVNLPLLERALANGDIDAALRAAGVRQGMWTPLTEVIRSSYAEAGAFTMAADVPRKFGMYFDVNNPRAQEYLRVYSSSRITGDLLPTQIDAIQRALARGFEQGRNPRVMALDLVGRVSPATGNRQGGLLHLSAPQQVWSDAAQIELANGDPNYLKRKLRDRRFDAAFKAAREEGRAMSSDLQRRALERYEDRLLKLRGDTVGRTEALNALNAAADESIEQIIEEGLAPRSAILRVWRHSFSPNERPGHRRMDGQRRPPGEMFRNPVTGASLLRPGSGEAAETINCRCMIEHEIDFNQVE